MRKLGVLGVVLAAACGGPPPAGPGVGSTSAALGAALACTPGQTFCQGNTRWMCDFNGDDASDPRDCSAPTWGGPGSATNPHVCAAGDCADGSAFCCRYAHPLCAFSMSQPAALDLRDYGADDRAADATVWCKPPRDYPDKALEFYVSDSGADGFWFFVAIGDATLAGQTVEMPDSRVDAALVPLGHGTFICDDWTGTVTWRTPRPAWTVDLDLTCASDPDYRIVGTFSGDE